VKPALLLPLLLLADPGVAPAPPAAPNWTDRLAFNARERTERGLAALGAEQAERALGAFDAALRLAPADPLVRYNAGTGHLAAGDAGAAALLEQATAAAPPDLAPAAWYNLGNARLGGADARGAIDAYREALLRRPDFAAAKHNLELALRELERQRQEQEKKQQDQKQQQEKQQQEQPQEKQDPQPGAPDQQPPEQQPQQGEQQPQQGEPGAERQRRPLPQFRDQEDMTAEQAAAILQAVENLEREQRREQALEQARAKSGVEKDW
jgi:outer membrane biosynthesis protein TonB